MHEITMKMCAEIDASLLKAHSANSTKNYVLLSDWLCGLERASKRNRAPTKHSQRIPDILNFSNTLCTLRMHSQISKIADAFARNRTAHSTVAIFCESALSTPSLSKS